LCNASGGWKVNNLLPKIIKKGLGSMVIEMKEKDVKM
jgi:hypothetical protein